MKMKQNNTVKCNLCAKIQKRKATFCKDCGKYRGDYIPEGWVTMPNNNNAIMYPHQMVCPECQETDEYKKVMEQYYEYLRNNHCGSCGEKKDSA